MQVLEYRTKGSLNKKKPGEPGEILGKKGDVIAELDPKTDDSVMKETGLEEEDLGENEAAIQERFDFEKPFFILGHAGWAKTSIVKRLAKKNGYRILIVYLDKACKEDLGGMPIVVDDPKYKGEKTVKMVPPDWAKDIIYNPNDKFLLFFDEMNQADPEVMNALMPIVQDGYIPGANPNDPDPKKRNKMDNFFVGAAGNYSSENKATHELSGPLLSRFKPLIIWEDNNDAAWEDTFKFWRKDYEPILGKKFIDAFWPYHSLFDNPRELNEKLWDPFIKIKKKGLQNSKRYSAERIARYIYGGKGENGEDRLIKQDIDSSEAQKYANEMAEIIYDWLHEGEEKDIEGGSGENGEGGEKKQGMSRRRGTSEISINETVRAMIDSAVTKGYIDGNTWGQSGKLYAINRENIFRIFDPADVTAQGIFSYLKHLKSKGTNWKYKSVEDAIKNIKAGSAKVLDPIHDPDLPDEWGPEDAGKEFWDKI